jgi:hypothetical protein
MVILNWPDAKQLVRREDTPVGARSLVLSIAM